MMKISTVLIVCLLAALVWGGAPLTTGFKEEVTPNTAAAVPPTTAAGVVAATASPTTLEVHAPAKVSPTKHHCCAPFCCDECCDRKSSAPAVRLTTGRKAAVAPTTAAGVVAATASPTTLEVPAPAKVSPTKRHCCEPFCCDECCDRKSSAPAVRPTTGRKAAVAPTTAAGVVAATASPTTLEVPAPAKVSPTKRHCCAPFCCDECCDRKSSEPVVCPTTGCKATVAPTTAVGVVAATALSTTLEVPAPAKVSPTKRHCCAPFCCDECCDRKSSAPAVRPTSGRKAAVAPTTAAATVPPATA